MFLTARQGAAALAATTAAAAALMRQQYLEYEKLVADCAVSEEHLPLTAEAQRTAVHHIPKLLSEEEVDQVHAIAAELKPHVGSDGRNENNVAAAYRSGKWETLYLSTDNRIQQRAPWLRERLVAACHESDENRGWKMLERATTPLGVRCVEYHTVEPGGSLPFPTHFDSSSLITIDVMLSDPSTEFEGGQFSTLEADGTMKEYSHFKKGDALVFVSHKFHCVSPVSASRRHVLVMELWEGEERGCAHRCERQRGHCGHSVRTSFWRRMLNDIASDL